jgi:hypothetical protein
LLLLRRGRGRVALPVVGGMAGLSLVYNETNVSIKGDSCTGREAVFKDEGLTH